MTVYEDIWAEFSQGDHISQMPLWEGAGLGLIVLVQDEAILKRIAGVQGQIKARLDIPTVPLDTAHITVRSFGQVVDRPQTAHKLSPDRIPAIIDVLTPLLHGVPQFDIHLKRIGSFFVCPIAEAHDGGAIGDIRAKIASPLTDIGLPDFDYGPRGFVPHLTLAYYPQDDDGEEARQVIAELRDAAELRNAAELRGPGLGTVHVDTLSLVKAEMNDQLCCLETIHKFKLKEKI